MRLLVCIALVLSVHLGLASCYRVSEHRTRYGQFDHVERLRANSLDFEGGNTVTDGESLCSLVDPNLCIRDPIGISIRPSANEHPHFLVAVATKGTWVLDARSGRAVDMKQCQQFLPNRAGRRVLDEAWSLDQTTMTTAVQPEGERIEIVEFGFGDDQSVVCRIVATYLPSPLLEPNCPGCRPEISSLSSDADNRSVAWLRCSPHCVLLIQDRRSLAIDGVNTGCRAEHQIAVRWRRSEPEIVNTWFASQHDGTLCADDEGRPRYRVEAYAFADPSFAAWAERAALGEFDVRPFTPLRRFQVQLGQPSGTGGPDRKPR
ncbi:MAG: hypothetical protein HYV17_14205 [Xanthomonadales bacterium]|nr:hypothetical protein [Xanthomonadales bacterium]